MAIFLTVVIGIIGGIVSGLLGVGGGLIFVPLMVFILGFNMHLAIGTSLMVIVPTALAGGLRHAHAGMVDWKTALILVICAVLGSWVGAGLSIKMDLLLLRRIFAFFLVAIALKLFFQN